MANLARSTEADVPDSAHPRPEAGGKLLTLEAGRFVAALSVMLYHYVALVMVFCHEIVLGDIFRAGHAGVPYFFVLSGFIIGDVHRRDLGRPDRLGRFLVRRAIRLYPMFWLVSLAMLAGFVLAPHLAEGRDLGIFSVVTDLLLLPHADAILPISWTLRHEMVFYGLFALAIAFGPRAFWLIGAWVVASIALEMALPAGVAQSGGLSVICGVANLGFALGLATQALARRPATARGGRYAAFGLAAFSALCALEWWLGHGVPHAVSVLGPFGEIGYMLAAAIAIFGLVRIETGGWRMPAPGLWKLLGGCSYTLYLVHQPVGSVMVRLFASSLPATIVFLLTVAAALTAALALHVLVERPVLRLLQRAVAHRETGAAPVLSPIAPN